MASTIINSHATHLKVIGQLPPVNEANLIGTHDGSFHCDEALAISLLTSLPEYQKSTIIRTRNPDILAKCAIVVDVGAIYDPSTHRYDHHQREFTGTFSEKHHIKLSSAGLVYKHFGKRIIQSLLYNLSGNAEAYNEELAEVCYQKMYDNFIQHIDGIDNGVQVADGELKYDISTTLSARVGRFNPAWNEDQSNEVINQQFVKAMVLTSNEFIEQVSDMVTHWWPARSIVKHAIVSRLDVHPSGSIVILEQYCPWQSHLFDIETELNMASTILYILYQDSGGSWRIQAVPEKPGSFQSRKKLGPESWHGLRDDVLSEKTNIPGCIFIHATGFIGGHKTKEGALALAVKSLE